MDKLTLAITQSPADREALLLAIDRLAALARQLGDNLTD